MTHAPDALRALVARALERSNTAPANAASVATALVQAEIDGERLDNLEDRRDSLLRALQTGVDIGERHRLDRGHHRMLRIIGGEEGAGLGVEMGVARRAIGRLLG